MAVLQQWHYHPSKFLTHKCIFYGSKCAAFEGDKHQSDFEDDCDSILEDNFTLWPDNSVQCHVVENSQ